MPPLDPDADLPIEEGVIYFLQRGPNRVAAETRLNPLGPGYELVVTTDGVTHVESFNDLPALLSREHELLQAWRALGWRETTAAATLYAAQAHAVPDEEDSFGRRR
jgi:hypothetical protein